LVWFLDFNGTNGGDLGFVQALDKIRFESLTNKSKLDAQPELFIRLVPDKTNNTLSIIDSGVGMTKAGSYKILLTQVFSLKTMIWANENFVS
jgi:HSP90 family molecular chaperone